MRNSLQLILPGLIVAITALVVFVVDLVTRRKAALAWVAAAGLLIAAAVSVGQWVDFTHGLHGLNFHARVTQTGFAGSIGFDKYATYFTLLFCGIGLLTVMLSDAYMTARRAPLGEFYGLLLLIVCGMIGMAIATDLITFFIAFELMSLPTYVLAGFLRGDEHSGEAAMKYFVNGAFSSAILVFGLALLFGASGDSNYLGVNNGLAAVTGVNGIAVIAVVLVVTGFLFKISAVPFHSWAPDVYEGAPTPVTAFMSTGVKAGAFAGFLKLLTIADKADATTWANALIIFAIPTMIVGNVLALPQRNLKRMLAYSSIAHAGYILLGLIAAGKSGNDAGLHAVLFYVAVYAFMNIGAFGVLVWIRARRDYDYSLDGVAGLGRSMPLASLAMALFMFSLAGIPPAAGFWGKFYLFTAVVNAGYWWLAVIAVIMSTISAYYYLRVVWYMFFREAEPELAVATLDAGPSIGVGATLAIAVAAIVAIGLYPTPLIRFASTAIRSLIS
jgi:NADH-quinone oxidoreductase subunit N